MMPGDVCATRRPLPPYAPYSEPEPYLGRGYCGHEHLTGLGLINMNARLYDPVLGRFLMADPYVQAPDMTQNFNRYSYCLNNPLRYSDRSGELFGIDDAIIVIVAAAVIGGTANAISNSNNIHSFGDALGYFGIGAAAGAIGAYAGSAIAIGGVLGGALSGLVAGASSGAILGGGNSMMTNGNFSHFWTDAFNGMLVGGISGAVIGGVTGGISSYVKGENIWTGEANPTAIGPRQPQNPQPDAIPSKAAADVAMDSGTSPEISSNMIYGDVESFQTFENYTEGFKTFREFKKAYGTAGSGYDWHHIVEQTPSNITKFGPEKIHNINNIIRLQNGTGSHHALISGFYSSKQNFTGGLTVRQWLSTKSFTEQYEFGLKIIILKW